MDRNDRARVIYRAERMERATKPKGRKNGVLGHTGLNVLRGLVFKFGKHPTPSYDDIKRATGHCLDTVSQALKRLVAAGLIEVEHRSIRTAQGWRRITNAYAVPRQASLPLDGGELRIPEGSKKAARFVPFVELTGPVRDALDALGARIRAAGAATGLPSTDDSMADADRGEMEADVA